MSQRTDPLQPVDARARSLASRLLRTADTGSLATVAEEDGHPFASLVTTATDFDGSPVLLLSMLSSHTRALLRDPRCSLLVGQPGKGDPLAHPRLTAVACGRRIDPADGAHTWLRSRFLARHPAAIRYADFADFDFFRLEILRARLNGGFANAFAMQAADVLAPASGDPAAFAAVTLPLIEQLNRTRLEDVRLIARERCAQAEGPWRLVGIDPWGVDLKSREHSVRYDFDDPPVGADDVTGRVESLMVQSRERGD